MKIFNKLFFIKKQILEKDLFFGLHIHKTAGMTLLDQFKSQLSKDQHYINSMYAVNFKQNVKELEERSPEELEKIRIVFGHGVHEYMLSYFKDKNIKLFTFLREPISRIFSWYCYDRKLLKRFSREIPSFEKFYKKFFPHLSICSMLTRAFPTFIDSQDDPLYLQAISILRKFHFVATIEDFSTKTPVLFNEMGISFLEQTRKNITNYKRELDFEDQVDYDFLLEDNRDDIKLYEAVQEVRNSEELNYFGFDASGYEKSMHKMFSRNVNPYAALLRNHRCQIKRNYKLENVYNNALGRYEKDFSDMLVSHEGQEREFLNLLIKLYALEEKESKKKYYEELLTDLNEKFDLRLSRLLERKV